MCYDRDDIAEAFTVFAIEISYAMMFLFIKKTIFPRRMNCISLCFKRPQVAREEKAHMGSTVQKWSLIKGSGAVDDASATLSRIYPV